MTIRCNYTVTMPYLQLIINLTTLKICKCIRSKGIYINGSPWNKKCWSTANKICLRTPRNVFHGSWLISKQASTIVWLLYSGGHRRLFALYEQEGLQHQISLWRQREHMEVQTQSSQIPALDGYERFNPRYSCFITPHPSVGVIKYITKTQC